jgi:hypothetical protein
VERTLVQLPSCHVFRIPPRRAAEGYRASEWTEKVWQGRLRIVQKGREAAIILVDADNNVFAVCPIKEGAVEKSKGPRSLWFVVCCRANVRLTVGHRLPVCEQRSTPVAISC